MADKYCGQVNIPTVNNDAIACRNYYDTNCVIYQDPIAYFGTTEPSTSTEVFNFLIASLSDARSRIVTLESASAVNFDLVPTDGSINAVQSNGIFDALSVKLEDAPSNGTQYVRLNGAWAPLAGAANVLVGDNVAVATTPLPAYTTGAGNASFGDRALENAITINGTVALGDMAGFYASNTETPTEGVTPELTTVTDGIFIGAEAKPNANNSINEIVIGAQAYGNGSNTATFGDLRVTNTYLRGDVTIQAGAGTGLLTTAGGAIFNDSIVVQGGISVLGQVDGRDIAADGAKLDGIEVGATADQNAAEVPITDAGSFFTATDVEGALQELATASGGITDGDRGDITVSGSGAIWTVDPQAVTFGKIQNVTTGVFAGRVSSGSGSLEELSGAQAMTLLPQFSTTTTTQGVVPGSNNVGATFYLDATGNWSVPAGGGGASNTIYTADDALTGARIVTTGTNQLTFSGTGGDIVINSGRLGVSTAVFGPSRLGDSVFQTPAIDTQSINIKDGALNTALAIFSSAVGTTPGDGFVTTMKNFTDSVNVISIAAADANQLSGTRQVESTIGLRNDYQDNSFTVLDMFNQDYAASATDVAQKMGWVAIHGGGATAKPVGLWRYDGTTYTNIWELNPSNVLTFGVDVNVPDEVYGVSWNGSTEVPTKNAVYDAIEAIDLSNYVTLDTQQTISGFKVFNRADASLPVAAFIGHTRYSGTIPSFNDSSAGFGYDTLSDTWFFQEQNGTLNFGLLDFKAITQNRTYTFPNNDGIVLLGNAINPDTSSGLVTQIGRSTRERIRLLPASNSLNLIGDDGVNSVNVSIGPTIVSAEGMTTAAIAGAASNKVLITREYADANYSGGGGATVLNDLTDVTITAASTGEYLRYNGAAWVDATIQASDIPLLTDYVAVAGDTMTGPLTMASNILADTTSTRDIGTFAIPFYETFSRRFIIKKPISNKSWRFEGNQVGDDLGINVEATANSNTWIEVYRFNATGSPVNGGDIVNLSYLENNFLELTGNQSVSGVISFTNATASTTKDTGAVVIANGGLGVEGAINAGGDITAFASSDPRLKDNMTRISNPMEILSQMSGYNFVWNDKQGIYEGADIGLNALEVQEVIPSAVRESSPTVGGWLQVDYKRVIPVLVEAIKEKDAENKDLKAQLQAQGQLLQSNEVRLRELEDTVRYLINKVG
jgi:hypothetical protein